MRSSEPYEIQRIIESERFQHRERDVAHRRGLREQPGTDGVVRRVLARLAGTNVPSVLPPVLAPDTHELIRSRAVGLSGQGDG